MALRLTLLTHARAASPRSGSFSSDEPVEMDGQSKQITLYQTVGRTTRCLHAPERRTAQTAAMLSANSAVDVHLRDWDKAGGWAKGLTT